MTSEPEVHPRPGGRVLAVALLLAYAAVGAWVLLTPDSNLPAAGVAVLESFARDLGLPTVVVSRVEELANVAIVVPVPVLAAFVWRPWPVLVWTGGAFVVSLAVEVVQRLLLGDRIPSATDVVANTAGGLAGGLVSAVVMGVRRLVLRHRDAPRPGRP